jgi:hypothetical protein
MIARKLGFGLVAMAVLAVSATASPLPRYGVFAFSDACWEEESGDAAGNRALLVRNGDGDRLTWEWSDGPMEGPVPATALSIDGKTGHISFDVDLGSAFGKASDGTLSQDAPYVLHFTGRVSGNGLAIATTDAPAGRTDFIPRTRNFAAKTPMCPPIKPR